MENSQKRKQKRSVNNVKRCSVSFIKENKLKIDIRGQREM